MPPSPDLFGEWQWYNGIDGIFYWVETPNTDAFIATALTKLDGEYAECEADVIDATGGVENLDLAGDTTCTAGSTCFRLRMITKGAPVWNGDTDVDEGGC